MKTLKIIGYLAVALLAGCANAGTATTNGFDLNGVLIPADEILSGGPPKDGIPAIDKPVFVKASLARLMRDDDRVLAITHNGISKAYPVLIMNWHEIVNDQFGDDSIAVTYCPLCGSGIAFKADVAGKTLKFGVSGLLYNSDVLLFTAKRNRCGHRFLPRPSQGQ